MTAKKPKTTRKRSAKPPLKPLGRVSFKELDKIGTAMNVIDSRNGIAREWDHELAEAASLILTRYRSLVLKYSELTYRLSEISKDAWGSNF